MIAMRGSRVICGVARWGLAMGICVWGVAARAQAPAASTAPKAKEEAAISSCDQLTPYQKSQMEQMVSDWAFLGKYRGADQELGAPKGEETRVVFMGDSITAGWEMKGSGNEPDRSVSLLGKGYVNRGISGQTTPQMLVRFRQDVIELKPKAVVLLAGTNDIAENTGKMTLEETEGNLTSMSELARVNGIQVVLCSVLPASDFRWHPGLEPAPKIRVLNEWIKGYAAKNGFVYVDYYSHMANDAGGLKSELSADGVHPNAAGYAIMGPLAEAGIAAALAQ